MKRTAFLAALVLVGTCAFAQFRNTTWGMSVEQVIEIEGDDFTAHEDSDPDREQLWYRRELLDFRATVIFTFNSGELYSASYSLPDIAWHRTSTALEQRFGRPTTRHHREWSWNDSGTMISIRNDYRSTWIHYTDLARSREISRRRAEADAAAF